MLFGLLVSMYLQFGYLDAACYKQSVYDSGIIEHTFIEQQPYYADFGINFEKSFYIKDFSITPFFYTSINTMMVPIKWNSWHPTQNYYKIGGGVKINNFIEFGISHICYHPSAAYMLVQNYLLRDSFEGGSDNFYVRFEISNKEK